MVDMCVKLTWVDSPELWDAARRLVEEYAASLGIDLGFQDFEREIASLPSEYGPPAGWFVLAEVGPRDFVGCGGVRPLSDGECEMKRLYVAPAARGSGAGRVIAEALIERARQSGYRAMLLDTLPSMRTAQSLYRSLGFEPTEAYRFNPVPGASFWRLDLDRWRSVIEARGASPGSSST
jgi:putative acetyltransferase